jgi:hypothetical protein
MSKGKLERLAETPRYQIDRKVMKQLTRAAEDPRDLKRIVKHAQEQQPPNEVIIGLVGAFAYVKAFEEFDIDQRDGYPSVVEKAFPDLKIERVVAQQAGSIDGWAT